jgi:hypothetical protein
MRTASFSLLLIALAVAVCGATTDHMTIVDKEATATGEPTYEGRDVGEDISSAIPITALPFSGSGNTCGFLNDYDVTCPYPYSVAPDVVYSFTPAADVVVNASLCSSTYDTKLYIFEGGEGNIVCCNDDECGPLGYQSFLENVFLYAGATYYFVIDGYNEDCGDYVFEVIPLAPCDVVEPPEAIAEGEPGCGPGYVDTWNGGCNSDPPVFQTLWPSGDAIRVFGTSGTYDHLMRDTDWYQIYTTAPNIVTASVLAEFPVLVFFLDGNLPLGCNDPGIVISSATGAACEPVELTEMLDPGLYWIWVGPSTFSCLPCDVEYSLEVTGYVGPAPVEVTSWGTIKALYR